MYCSIAEGLLNRLQSVQNAAARLVTALGRREHITPVRQRVQLKLATLVHRLLQGTVPAYLSDECYLIHPLECVVCTLGLPDMCIEHTAVIRDCCFATAVLVRRTVPQQQQRQADAS